MNKFLLILFLLHFCSCQNSNTMKSLDVQGHRGCRGLMPENTVQAFTKAMELGVTTLEMDLVITKDKEVIVSHEPFFSHEISTGPDGNLIAESDELNHNIYALTYDECTAYDVGTRPHTRFPNQQKFVARKPLFKDVVKKMEAKAKSEKLALPYYNVEIKRQVKWDNTHHPDAGEFAALVVKEVQNSNIKERIVIQSFDPESLRIVRELDPEIGLVLLIQNKESIENNIENLGFIPDIYSPYYLLINEATVAFCKDKNMLLIPWTVNEVKDMKDQIALGVDGIITDYPDRLIALMKKLDIEVK